MRVDHPFQQFLTVAVTGHRPNRLHHADLNTLSDRVDLVLDCLLHLAAIRGNRGAVLVSGLAEGSDRIVAERALVAGFELRALLPMAPDAYEEDFATEESISQFRQLLDASSQVDALTSWPRKRAKGYEALGDRLIEEADLLIAIWDGRPGQGPGGTADVVKRAGDALIPTVWIYAWAPHQVAVLADGRAELIQSQGPEDGLGDGISYHLEDVLRGAEDAEP